MNWFVPSCSFSFQGHAIEAGWFLLRCAMRQLNSDLQFQAVEKFMKQPFRSGWDPEHGGLFAFQDVDGFCPTQVWTVKSYFHHKAEDPTPPLKH